MAPYMKLTSFLAQDCLTCRDTLTVICTYQCLLGTSVPNSLVVWVSQVGLPKTLILILTKDWRKWFEVILLFLCLFSCHVLDNNGKESKFWNKDSFLYAFSQLLSLFLGRTWIACSQIMNCWFQSEQEGYRDWTFILFRYFNAQLYESCQFNFPVQGWNAVRKEYLWRPGSTHCLTICSLNDVSEIPLAFERGYPID